MRVSSRLQAQIIVFDIDLPVTVGFPVSSQLYIIRLYIISCNVYVCVALRLLSNFAQKISRGLSDMDLIDITREKDTCFVKWDHVCCVSTYLRLVPTLRLMQGGKEPV